MFLPQESFHGGIGETSDESPALHRFGGDGVFLHAVEAIVMQTSYSDGHFVEGTKAGLFSWNSQRKVKHHSGRSLTSEIQ